MGMLDRGRVPTGTQPARGRRRGGCWKAAGILGATALVLALAVAALGLNLFRHPLPATSGTLALRGLTAPVTVVRDHAGMPHLTGATMRDLFRAQGYVVAQDRLWQLDFYRRVGAGRLSEVLGTAALDNDRLFRTIGWRRAAQQELNGLPAEYKTYLQDYADGINAFLESHADALPVEFTILGYKPEPWTPLDTVTFGKVMAWDLSENLDIEITMADLQAKLGAARAAQLLPAYSDGQATIVQHSALPGNPLGHVATGPRLSGIFGANHNDTLVGSNNWVIGGEKSADGHPLLANDPHLRVQNPSIWYAIQLRATDGSLDAEGVTFAGAPGIVVGHNRDIAWGVTNLGPDTQDLFVETVDPAGHPGQYQYQGTWRPLSVLTETIGIKGEAAVTLVVTSTMHGPMLDRGVYDTLSGPAALQWTGLLPGGLLEDVLKLDQALDWDSFHAALATWDVPGQNFVFADSKGNIGYQATGRWPIRPNRTGLVPADGASGAAEWAGFVPYEQLPRVYNPPEHFIVTANNRVVGPTFPHQATAWWFSPYRADRITAMINATPKLSVADVKAMQYDTHNVLAARVGQRLAAVTGGDAPVQAAVARFRNWDGNISGDSATAALYEVTYRQILTNTLADDLGGTLTAEYLSNAGSGAAMLLDRLLDDSGNAWWDDVSTPQHEGRDDILRKSLGEAANILAGQQGADMNQWHWSAMHSITFSHVLGAAKPLDRLLNLGPYPTGGDSYTVNVGSAGETAPGSNTFSQTGHPSMRLIMDTGDWSATQLVFSPGESGQVGSAHWGDQVQGWLHGTYQTLPWADEQIRQTAEGTLTLQP